MAPDSSVTLLPIRTKNVSFNVGESTLGEASGSGSGSGPSDDSLPIRTRNVSFNVGESTIGEPSGSGSGSASSEPSSSSRRSAPQPEVSFSSSGVLEIPASQGYQWNDRVPLQSNESQQARLGLMERDLSAIEYTKSLLLDGDTMVVIHYPNDRDLYDPAGFKVSKTNHQIHSEKLLATGSQVFQKLLGERAQERARRRAGFAPPSKLPPGIKYVLDLTPPYEGDEAIDLLSNLSCSPGIRLWAKTAVKFGVEDRHVNGKDEFMRASYYPIDEKICGCDSDEDEDEAEKIKKMDPSLELAAIPEYCPIRHRAGIERLLRLIEGRDSKLDSAPKVLTLAYLAKFFDCTAVVAGYIESWILSEPNNKFFEILPEEAFKIGLWLKSKMITEPAFAVLVSEGAFLAAARMQPSFAPRRDNSTQFGRLKGDINEDELNRIEAAADDFQSRVNGVATKLVDPSMSWIHDIPEFGKITQFRERSLDDPKAQKAVENIINKLKHYVRGEIISVEMQSLSPTQNFTANGNRSLEHYMDFYAGNFEDLYDTLSPSERYLTRFYWDLLRLVRWDSTERTTAFAGSTTREMRREVAAAKGVEEVDFMVLIDSQEYLNNLIRLARDDSFLDQTTGVSTIFDQASGSSHDPKTPTSEKDLLKPPARKTNLDDFWDFDGNSDSDEPLLRACMEAGPGPSIDGFGSARERHQGLFGRASAKSTSTIRSGMGGGWAGINEIISKNYAGLPYFSLSAFMIQVQSHLAPICVAMARDPYFGIRRSIDTLTCMSPEELKYLPLWADGNEDGTGGVFQKAIPPAEFGVAPNGPGPAFHTGVSVFSQASSMVEVTEDDQMTEVGTVNTSVAVDNGMSGHVDRRAIMSDFGSIASFVHVSENEGKGKEKEIEVKQEEKEMTLSEMEEQMDTESVDTYDFKLSDIDSSSVVSHDADEDNDEFMMVSDDDDDDIEFL